MQPRKDFVDASTNKEGGFDVESNENPKMEPPKPEDDLTLRDMDSIVEYMDTLLEDLDKQTGMCPKVDEKGKSECPFAEDVYAKKDMAAEEVTEHLQKLRVFPKLLQEEWAKLRSNLAQVREDLWYLHDKSAREKYRSSAEALEKSIQKNLDKKQQILDLISRAEKLLDLAYKKKWPLGKPKEQRNYPLLTLGSAFNPGPSLGTEVGSLFSLGPIGGAQPLVSLK
jgi:hypothetical protein